MTIGRYKNDETDLTLNERVGGRFIHAAKQIYLLLLNFQEAKKIRFDAKFKAIVPAINDLHELWVEFEKDRPTFKLTADLRSNYQFAMRRYRNMKRNPTEFYETDNAHRQELEKEKAMLAEKIKNDELDFSRAEDVRRMEIQYEKKGLNTELAVLQYRKKNYEDREKRGRTGCLPCGTSAKSELGKVSIRIGEIEA